MQEQGGLVKYRPIQQKFLNEGWGLAFQWQEGWTFLHIQGRFLSRIRKYTIGLTKIATEGTLDFLELKDPNGQKIFDVLDRHANRLVIHVGIGIKPAQVKMFVRWPSGVDIRPVPNVDPVALGVQFTGNMGWISSEYSPYNSPTEAAEFWFPYTMDATFGFVNTDKTRVHAPVLNIEMAIYNIEVLDPSKGGDLELIKRMCKGQVRTRYVTMGPPWQIAQYELAKNWKVEPVEMSALRNGGV